MANQNGKHGGENLGVILVTALLVLIFLFAWPGVLRFEYVSYPGGLVRIDRITKDIRALHNGEFLQVNNINEEGVWILTTGKDGIKSFGRN